MLIFPTDFVNIVLDVIWAPVLRIKPIFHLNLNNIVGTVYMLKDKDVFPEVYCNVYTA